jgi:restriction system-associated AAA family ATPase
MKLLRLKLNTEFRSLHAGFEVHFLRDFDEENRWAFNPYCLAGRNGSGKSNIMEALAAIFYHIECMYLDYKPEGFEEVLADEEDAESIATIGFSRKKCNPDAFELEYLFHVKGSFSRRDFSSDFDTGYEAHILIEKKPNEAPQLFWKNRSEFEKDKDNDKALTGLEVKKFLPEYVIGYSSGENEILSLPFLKMRFLHYDEYLDRLRGELDYNRPEGRFIYADAGYSQAIFLANYLMQDDEVLAPFLDVLGIRHLDQFRIIIRRDEKVTKIPDEEIEYQVHGAELTDMLELTSQVENSIITKLGSCATAYHRNGGVQYFDYLVNDETRKAFRLQFDNNPVSLFQSLQVLLTLNLFEVSTDLKRDFYNSESLYVNETIPVLPSDKRVMRFKDFLVYKNRVGELLTKSLSDGEHQFLHAIGLCLLFKDSNSLFLLDEPETHLNPDWRASFISVLKECLSKSEGESFQDLLISSHSPFIISDCHESNVLIFRKDESGKVSCERPDFKTFGASVNQITIKVFGQTETIGDYARNELKKLQNRLDANEDVDELIDEANRLFGDSVEKVMFINKALDKKEGK